VAVELNVETELANERGVREDLPPEVVARTVAAPLLLEQMPDVAAEHRAPALAHCRHTWQQSLFLGTTFEEFVLFFLLFNPRTTPSSMQPSPDLDR
jgi:hypothetical protein